MIKFNGYKIRIISNKPIKQCIACPFFVDFRDNFEKAGCLLIGTEIKIDGSQEGILDECPIESEQKKKNNFTKGI